MIEQHQMAQFLNSLFLSNDMEYAIEQLKKGSLDWTHFLSFLQRNKVTVRTLQKLREQGAKLPEDAENALSLAEKKKQQKLRVIRRVDALFSDNRIKYVLLKFVDSLPDLGRDTDYLVGEQFKHADRLIRSNFHAAKPISLSLSDRLTKSKSSFFIGEVELELYGRITQIGETQLQSNRIIERATEIRVDGLRIPVPSFEDNLLITCVHAMYRHRRIKYSELLVAVKAISSNNVDWKYIFKSASEAGILFGLLFLLSTAKRLLNQSIWQPENMQFEQLSWTKSFPAAVPTLKVNQLYMRKLLNEIKHLRLSSASRVGIIPFIGVFAELSAKLHLGLRIW